LPSDDGRQFQAIPKDFRRQGAEALPHSIMRSTSNHMLNVAPQDGTVLTMVTSTVPMDQALVIGLAMRHLLRKHVTAVRCMCAECHLIFM
jgi:hypothetical protein